MPLLTPVSYSSSRPDDVIILRPDSSAYPFEEPPRANADVIRAKEKILILGPFLPQTLSLSSSDSSESPPVHRRIFPTISIPYPSYEDCFAPPVPPGSDIFNPLEYESSVPDIDEDREGDFDVDDSFSVFSPTPRVDYENEHRRTVMTRLEEVDDLMSSVHSVGTGLDLYHPVLDQQGPITPGQAITDPLAPPHEPFGHDFNLETDTDPFKEPNMSGNNLTGTQVKKTAYKIPQLRDVLFCDISPGEGDSHCHACHALAPPRSMQRVIPCHDIICGRCFSAAVGAVSEGHPKSRCPACLRPTTGFAKLDHRTKHSIHEVLARVEGQGQRALRQEPDGPIIMRIDNVAWDLTPEVVRDFLPDGTLADIPVPVHIPLNRYDGRTKDYMYIEVISREAACTILQTCQNAPMPGGPLTAPRKRAVTITQVHPSELLREVYSVPYGLGLAEREQDTDSDYQLRPHSAFELHALLSLCQASVSVQPPSNHTSSYVAPNGLAHFVKNRHGPFNALMSILSKVKGKESPVYWDLFHITSGAIAALASHISRSSDPAIISQQHHSDPDRIMLKKLTGMFESVLSIKLENGRFSPI